MFSLDIVSQNNSNVAMVSSTEPVPPPSTPDLPSGKGCACVSFLWVENQQLKVLVSAHSLCLSLRIVKHDLTAKSDLVSAADTRLIRRLNRQSELTDLQQKYPGRLNLVLRPIADCILFLQTSNIEKQYHETNGPSAKSTFLLHIHISKIIEPHCVCVYNIALYLFGI